MFLTISNILSSGFNTLALCVLSSRFLLNSFYSRVSRSDENDVKGRLVFLLDDGEFLNLFLILFRSLASSVKLSVSKCLALAYLWCLSPSDILEDADGVSEKGYSDSSSFLPCSTSLVSSSTLLRINFATGRTNRDGVIARRANASMNIDDCSHRSLLRSNKSSKLPLRAIFVSTSSIKWNKAFSDSSFADLKPGRKASESAS